MKTKRLRPGLIVMLALVVVYFAALAAHATDDAEFLQLLYRRYTNEVAKAGSGRTAWHGAVKKSIILTNELRRIDIHADGKVFTNQWYNASSIKLKENNRRNFTRPPMTNGVPVKLAEARMRRWREKQGVSNVVISVEAGRN